MTTHRLLSTILCLGLLSAGWAASESSEETISGQVVPLPSALADLKIPADPEPIESQMVLKTSDGALIPLIRDDASRAFFLDSRLRSREAELRIRRHAGIPYVQVTTFKVLEDGKMRTPEYYCEVCSISVRYPQTCPCCQRPMEFRMRPESR